MQLSTSDPIDFVADDVVPILSSIADQAADHLGELPVAIGALAGSSTFRSWSLRGVVSVARRYPLVVAAVALSTGALYVWRKRRADAPPAPLQFPKSTAGKTTSPDTGNGSTEALIAPTTA